MFGLLRSMGGPASPFDELRAPSLSRGMRAVVERLDLKTLA